MVPIVPLGNLAMQLFWRHVSSVFGSAHSCLNNVQLSTRDRINDTRLTLQNCEPRIAFLNDRIFSDLFCNKVAETTFSIGQDSVSILQDAWWSLGPSARRNLPHRDSIPDRPARRESLYGICYLGLKERRSVYKIHEPMETEYFWTYVDSTLSAALKIPNVLDNDVEPWDMCRLYKIRECCLSSCLISRNDEQIRFFLLVEFQPKIKCSFYTITTNVLTSHQDMGPKTDLEG
jgi:hypothetical protein